MQNEGWARTRRALGTLGGAAIVVAAAGCASIIHGSKQDVQVASSPSAATVTLDGANSGTTPITLSVKRGAEHTVRIELAGYQPYETKLTKKIDGWFWGNLLIGGVLGIIIDASTGAMYKVNPNSVNATLTRGDLTLLRSREGLYIGVVLQADPSWERVGAMTRLPH